MTTESVEDRRRSLLRRAETGPPPWRWPERLALAGLGALLAGLALPWGTGPASDPLWLGQAGRTNGALVGIVAASVAVPLRLVLPRWDRLHALVGLAGACSVGGALAVWHPNHQTRSFLVPGRIAAVLGGTALIVAALAMGRSWAARRKAALAHGPAGRFGSWLSGEREPEEVARALRTLQPGPRGASWVGAGLVLVAAGAALLTGPWWRGTLRVRGPYEAFTAHYVTRSEHPRVVLDPDESAPTVRSGIEILGTARSWAVVGALLVAIAAVMWLGARQRSAQLIAACGAFVLGLVLASLVDPQIEGTPVPVVTVAVVALGVAVATVTLLRCWPEGSLRLAPLLLAGPGLLAATWSVVDDDLPAPEMDGPYQVLVDAPDWYRDRSTGGLRDSGVDAFDGSPAADVVGINRTPVWVDGLPGAVGMTDPSDGPGRAALWVVEDGRVDVRLMEGNEWPLDDLLNRVDVTDDGVVLGWGHLGSQLSPPRPWVVGLGRPGPVWEFPEGTDQATLGPDGRVWMHASFEEGPWSPGATYVATLDELTRPDAASRRIDEWPEEAGVPVGATKVVPGDDRLYAVTDTSIVAVDDDGSTHTVMGGQLDRACGLNREAAASDITRGQSRANRSPLPRIDDPLESAVASPDGGLWIGLPAPDPDDGRFLLGKVDPDGTLRIVDHPLPLIEAIAPSPDGDSVLVVDTVGRLLALPDAGAALETLPPPPDGCDPG